ncbi:MAG: ROK family protein [Bacteroidales bacterium]|nr:ROK family protein [Bacteroidales bacterium]
MKFRNVLGIDFGGSGIKGAPVDTKEGVLLAERYRIPTPNPANPENVIQVIKKIANSFKWDGPIGIAFPAVVQNGIVKTASNIDQSWIGMNAAKMVRQATGLPALVVNDADAAGMAEMKFGAGKGMNGLVLLVTVGTGIGTVLFSQGKLVPNSELGHIYLPSGREAEEFASDATRKKENLEWNEWGQRFNVYLKEMERLFWPELIIIGGGVSKKKQLFINELDLHTKLTIASAKNEAGIIGAALAARANRKSLKPY